MGILSCVTDPTAVGLILRNGAPAKVQVVAGNVPLEVAFTGDVHINSGTGTQVPFVGQPTVLVNNKPVVLNNTPSGDGGASTNFSRKVIVG